jgi:DNA gyrase/topoisomerase IV subunit B
MPKASPRAKALPVVAWTEEAPVRESYVNLIPTSNGGTMNRACAKACSRR